MACSLCPAFSSSACAIVSGIVLIGRLRSRTLAPQLCRTLERIGVSHSGFPGLEACGSCQQNELKQPLVRPSMSTPSSERFWKLQDRSAEDTSSLSCLAGANIPALLKPCHAPLSCSCSRGRTVASLVRTSDTTSTESFPSVMVGNRLHGGRSGMVDRLREV